MKKSIMKKWVKALRSGEYAQGKYALCYAGKEYDYFCCLGVLTDLYMQDVGGLQVYGGESTGEEYSYEFHDSSLTDEVMKWSGVVSETGHFIDANGVSSHLTTINDSRGNSFKRIADVIENNWEKL